MNKYYTNDPDYGDVKVVLSNVFGLGWFRVCLALECLRVYVIILAT